MNLPKSLVLTVAALTLAGCTRTQPPETPNQPVANAEWIAQYRASIEHSAPGSIVGVVNAVLPDVRLASVGDVPADQFKANQTLTFIDGAGNPLGIGSVVRVVDGNLHVRCEVPQPGRRAPEVGDVVVWLKR